MSMARLLAASLILLAVACGSPAEQAGPPPTPDHQALLDGLVTGPERIAPGGTAYVSGPNGTWLGAAGLADLETLRPMTPDARMRLESVSKIYTAALVARLEQDGLLSLEDTVERWLPGLLPYGDEITLRQLLAMSSGMVDNNDIVRAPRRYLANVGDPALRRRLIRLAERTETNPALDFAPIWWIRLAAWQPLRFEPGTGYHYSNIGYEVLGLVAARAAGRPLGALYEELLIDPLGLRATAYDPRGPIAGPHAKGYALASDRAETDTTEIHPGVGAEGGIVANAQETATFLSALMRGEVVDAAHVEALRGPALWAGGSASGCAGPAFGWSGGGAGYKTNVWVSGDGTRVAVLLLNGRLDGGGSDAAAQHALARLYCSA